MYTLSSQNSMKLAPIVQIMMEDLTLHRHIYKFMGKTMFYENYKASVRPQKLKSPNKCSPGLNCIMYNLMPRMRIRHYLNLK